jgi:hypothetical protein
MNGTMRVAKVLANHLAFERVPVTEKVFCLCTGSSHRVLQAVLALPSALVWPEIRCPGKYACGFLPVHNILLSRRATKSRCFQLAEESSPHRVLPTVGPSLLLSGHRHDISSQDILEVLLNQTVIPPFQYLQFQRVANREMNHYEALPVPKHRSTIGDGASGKECDVDAEVR